MPKMAVYIKKIHVGAAKIGMKTTTPIVIINTITSAISAGKLEFYLGYSAFGRAERETFEFLPISPICNPILKADIGRATPTQSETSHSMNLPPL